MSTNKKFLSGIAVLCLLTTITCTNEPLEPGQNSDISTLTDIDGNVYATVKIGTQVWMAENLRVTKYNDGSAITQIAGDTTWDSCLYTNTPAFCYYNNTTNADSINKYGSIYNWYVVSPSNPKKVAPAGWHVPTDSEWTIMEKYLVLQGFNWDETTDTAQNNKIAKSLSAKTSWETDETQGAIGCNLTLNNRSGFSALPGGCRGIDGSFNGIGTDGHWWSATAVDDSTAFNYFLSFVDEDLGNFINHKRWGYSVRLVKDN